MLTREEIRAAVPAAGFQAAIVPGARAYDAAALVRSISSVSTGFGDQGDFSTGCSGRRTSGFMSSSAMTCSPFSSRPVSSTAGIPFRASSQRFPLCSAGAGTLRLGGGRGQADSQWKRPTYFLVQSRSPEIPFFSASSVPIQGGDRTIGALTVYSARPDAFAALDLQVLWGVSASIGATLLTHSRGKTAPARQGSGVH